MPISADEFEAYEVIIRSGQMLDKNVPGFLKDNPDFSAWYLARHPPEPP